jgi:3',5'-cyclic AMP phosphodiesterase CpdA
MSRPFVLAHLSDVHLGPLPRLGVRHWNVKRTLGWLNWMRHRSAAHRPETLARLIDDLAAQQPDHIAVTGDLINIGHPGEYATAARWLSELGSPPDVSVVPGNHDIYTRLTAGPGIAQWSAYMSGDGQETDETFPYVRRRGPIALIGLNSAIPTRPFYAIGRIGEAQLARLAVLLDTLAGEGLVRVVVVHHAPLPGQTTPSHSLVDAGALEAVLTRHGADLVIHGHLHRRTLVYRPGPQAPVTCVGVPSASLAVPRALEVLARYHLYRITPGAPAHVELIARGLDRPDGPIVEIERLELEPDYQHTFTIAEAPPRE